MTTPPDTMLTDPTLTDRERRFVDEYLLDLNQAGAARRAGYSATWSKSLGSRLMARPHVRAAVERAMAERAARTKVDQDGVVQALAAVAFGDLRVLFDGTGALVPLDTLPDEAAAMLAGLDIVTVANSGGVQRGDTMGNGGGLCMARMRAGDRLKALELLGKHLGMFDRGSSGRRAPAGGDGLHPGFEVRFVDGDSAAARESPPS